VAGAPETESLTARRLTAVAIALALCASALAAAGCGLGPGRGLGEVSLTVTRDYGAEAVLEPVSDEVTEADTVMRVLERDADIETRYGGGFVQAIEGLEAEEEAGEGPSDWFFYVNGVESTVGAADYSLHGGEAIWWDYRDWSAAMRVPAVVGSWPRPLTGGYDGRLHPVSLACMGAGEACGIARERLRGAGVSLARGAPADAIRVLVGTWGRLRADPAAAQVGRGPQASGVFAALGEDGGCRVQGLDETGHPARSLGPGAGLVAATRRYEEPPTWVVTGCDGAGVRAAAGLLDAADLRDRYAVAVAAGGPPFSLPVRGG
jgi:hypothetical protein